MLGDATISPRSMRWPLAASAAFIACVAWLDGGNQGLGGFRIEIGANLVLAILAAVLSYQRAREAPAERTGWRLLVASRVVLAFILVAAMLEAVSPSILIATILSHAMATLGIWFWPGRRSSVEGPWLHVLGGVVFAGSFVLLLWLAGTWHAEFSNDGYKFTAVGQSARFVIVDALGLYLLSQSPQRVRSPLGWILAGSVTSGICLIAGGLMQTSLRAFAQVVPLGFVLAAWSRTPVDPPPRDDDQASWSVSALVYVPYLVVGALLGVGLVRGREGLAPPTLGFLALTVLIVARQILLLRELAQSKRRLEERVIERTRALESMQAAVMRTQRMNLTATMGAGLVHDLNNQLGVVLASADLMSLRLSRGDAVTLDLVEPVGLASRQAATMTKRLLSLARERKEEPAATTDVARVVAELVPLLRALVGRSVPLDVAPNLAPITVRCARDRAEHILLNLVTNARDALGAGGRIAIRLHTHEPGEARLEVEDNGAGISAEVRARLFEPFFTTKTEGMGTGLGLVAVRALAERDGGRVWVESEVGRGTTFTVSWPLLGTASERTST